MTEVSKQKKSRKNTAPLPIGECLLTLPEAAEVLRLHPRTVREYLRRGELEGRLIGRQWRFRRKDIDAFFESAPRGWDFGGEDGDGD
jgi:excisionase family DNA binding protein